MFCPRICIFDIRYGFNSITEGFDTICYVLYHWKHDINGQHNVPDGTLEAAVQAVLEGPHRRNPGVHCLHVPNTLLRHQAAKSDPDIGLLHHSAAGYGLVFAFLYTLCERDGMEDGLPMLQLNCCRGPSCESHGH